MYVRIHKIIVLNTFNGWGELRPSVCSCIVDINVQTKCSMYILGFNDRNKSILESIVLLYIFLPSYWPSDLEMFHCLSMWCVEDTHTIMETVWSICLSFPLQ